MSHIQGNAQTKVDVLGYKSGLVEYRQNLDASIKLAATPLGLVVSAVNGQRFYTNNRWPNPVVLRIENARFVEPPKAAATQSKLEGAK